MRLTHSASPALSQRDHAEDRSRIVELYDLLRPSLNAYLCSRGLSHDSSEDIIQETFLRLMRHTLKQGPDENLRAWIFRVAHNLSMDFHRSERRWIRGIETTPNSVVRDRVDAAPNPEQILILEERWRQFRGAVAQLTSKQRHCLLLRAKGLRYWEIAVILGVSVQRVGELMQRAISLVESPWERNLPQQ